MNYRSKRIVKKRVNPYENNDSNETSLWDTLLGNTPAKKTRNEASRIFNCLMSEHITRLKKWLNEQGIDPESNLAKELIFQTKLLYSLENKRLD